MKKQETQWKGLVLFSLSVGIHGAPNAAARELTTAEVMKKPGAAKCALAVLKEQAAAKRKVVSTKAPAFVARDGRS